MQNIKNLQSQLFAIDNSFKEKKIIWFEEFKEKEAAAGTHIDIAKIIDEKIDEIFSKLINTERD
jgi:hypothetical protein